MKTIEKTEEQLFKEILSGKFRDCYLIYNRKSTDEPDNQKNSIKYQKAENGKFAFREQLHIASITLKGFCMEGIVSEKHSGFKENNDITFTKEGLVQFSIDRPKFQRLIQFLSMGLFKGLVCLCWDRVSRNKGDDTIIRKLMRKGVDIRFAFAKYEKTSSGALHMDIDGMFAEHHSRVTSEKVTIATYNLRERGVCTYRAPIGYLNTGDMYHKPFDPERAPIIKKVFEMYASGDWSLADLVRFAKDQGLTTLPMRRRRTEEEMLAEDDEEDEEESKIAQVSRIIRVNHIHNILTNQFYTGKILGNDGQYAPSISHEALVSEAIFLKVQTVLKKKKVSIQYANKLPLYYRGLTRCSDCGRVYTPYEQKGIQYFGARCPVECSNKKKSFNIKFLEEKIGTLIENLSFSDEELDELNSRVKTDIALFEEKRLNGLEENDRSKKKIREDLTYLRINKLMFLKSGVYTPDTFLEEENKLNANLITLQNTEQISDLSMHEVIKDIKNLSELLKTLNLYYLNSESTEKEEIARVIFSELSISGNSLKYICKNGFQIMENRFTLVCDPTGNRTRI